MRTPLSRLVAGLLLITGTTLTTHADAAPTEVPPPDVYGIDLATTSDLPTGDLGLPAVGYTVGAGRSPAAPAVQAIPTPTAFHAGLGLMIGLLVMRRFRRRDGRAV